MPYYRRLWQAGGTYFFTVTPLRRNTDLLTRHIDLLRNAVKIVRRRYPFIIHGWVVLPDRLHCVIELPPEDTGFARRWRLIKLVFSKGLPIDEKRSSYRLKRGERGIWQRRYWEHPIRDERDFQAHLDYVHVNPLKHGLAVRIVDWPYSTFHRLVEEGVHPLDWCGDDADTTGHGE
ncbi:transposase|uniref:REP-associated tyrosine transposase n=1 Tax=Noviherbaspirillum sp. L7-7A TaxID=2850560 RepID=UPI001C2C8EF5|nr:transposase [Noviherbaspirillum sp. L7-7A]MBV0880866.1 transposase [Noviherbaspirillum sp. L7-7A]